MPPYGLFVNINQTFKHWNQEGILNLKPTKESTLKDFLVSYPEIVSKAAPCSSKVKCFHMSGMVDRERTCGHTLIMY